MNKSAKKDAKNHENINKIIYLNENKKSAVYVPPHTTKNNLISNKNSLLNGHIGIPSHGLTHQQIIHNHTLSKGSPPKYPKNLLF